MRQTAVNNKFVGDLEISASAAGTSRTLLIQNSDNSNAASHAKLTVTTGGASGGDPTVAISVTAANSCVGIDNDDSDSFKISRGSVPETTTAFRVSGGNVTRPLQPSFYAYRNGNVADVTGNATWYNVVFNAEIFDIGGNFNTTTGIFTAPADGNYYFSTATRLFDGSTNTSFRVDIITSDYTYSFTYGGASGGYFLGNYASSVTPMDSGDTAYVSIIGSGEASKREDLYGFETHTWFCGLMLQ